MIALVLALAAAVLAAPMPAPEVIDAGVFRIERVEGGDGPPLVLIHGIASSHETWRTLWPLLDRRFHLHAYDSLGTAGSTAPEGYDLDAHVAQLGAYLDAAGITEPAFLVGNSMGAQIAIVFASERPERVAGLALLDPSGGSRATPAFGATLKAAYEFASSPPHRGTEAFVRRVLLDLTADDTRVTDAMVAEYAARWSDPERHSVTGVIEEFRCDRPQHLYALRTAARGATGHPVLVVWGEDDPWFPAEGATDWTQPLPGARALIVPDAGHLPHVDQPRRVGRALVGAFARPLGPVAPAPIGLATLEDGIAQEDATLAAYHARALGDLGDAAAVPRLIGALFDPRTGVAEASVRALGDLGLPALEPVLDAHMQDARVPAERILGLTRDPEAIAVLVEALDDPSAASASAQGLALAGPMGLEALVEATTSADPVARAAAVTALGASGDPRARDARIALLSDPDPGVAKAAVKTFASRPDPRAVGPLVDRVERHLDGTAALTVGCAGEDAIAALAALLAEPTTAKALIGLEVAAGASRFTTCAKGVPADRLAPVVEPLLGAWPTLGPASRGQLVRILGRARDERAVDLLVGLLSDPDPGLRGEAAEALGAIGSVARAPALVAALGDPEARVDAALALAAIGDDGEADATPALLAMLAEGSDAAVRALGALGDPSAVEPLIAATRGDSRWVRLAAIEALGRFDDPRAVTRLEEIAAEGTDTGPLIGALGCGRHPRHVGVLVAMLHDPRLSESDRLQAAWTLSMLTGAWFPPDDPDAWDAWRLENPE